MKVAVELTQTWTKMFLVEVPDDVKDEGMYQAVHEAALYSNGGAWTPEPDWDSLVYSETTGIFRLNEDGDPMDEPVWPSFL